MIIDANKFLPVEEIRILSLIDNYFDGLLPPAPAVFRRRGLAAAPPGTVKPLQPPLTAEHGLSFYIEVTVNGEKHSLLMDFGGSPDGAARNIGPLKVKLSSVEAMVLSHGHFDHFLGMEALVGLIPGEKLPLPLYLGREAFARRFAVMPNGAVSDLGALSREKVEILGLEVREVGAPTAVLPGVLLTGEIPRVTPFEQGAPNLEIERDGQREKDLFPGELSLVFLVEGRGLVVVSACAHAGIVNTVRLARELTGEERVLAVLGGFHLTGAPDEKINKTVEALKEINPGLIAPMHCTGFAALKKISDLMPGSFTLNCAGTEYRFNAKA